MNGLTGSIKSIFEFAGTKAGALGGGNLPAGLYHADEVAFTFGAGANQANDWYESEATLLASGSVSLDFASGGGLVNRFGEAIAWAEIKWWWIKNTSTTQTLTIGGANNIPGLTNARTIGPGGSEQKIEPGASGIAVTGGTGDLITIANAAGGSCTYRIIAGGNS